MKYKSHWKVEELPDNGIMLARISDDVLDDKNWNTYRLTIKDGTVTTMVVQVVGVYSDNSFLDWIGMTKADLVEWQYESEPHVHPGYFRELAIGDVPILIEFLFAFADDKDGEEFVSEPVEFKDWKTLFSMVGHKTFLIGAHETSLTQCKKVVLKGLRRRYGD